MDPSLTATDSRDSVTAAVWSSHAVIVLFVNYEDDPCIYSPEKWRFWKMIFLSTGGFSASMLVFGCVYVIFFVYEEVCVCVSVGPIYILHSGSS